MTRSMINPLLLPMVLLGTHELSSHMGVTQSRQNPLILFAKVFANRKRTSPSKLVIAIILPHRVALYVEKIIHWKLCISSCMPFLANTLKANHLRITRRTLLSLCNRCPHTCLVVGRQRRGE